MEFSLIFHAVYFFILLESSLRSDHAGLLTLRIPLTALLLFHFLPYFWLRNTPAQLVLDSVVMLVKIPVVWDSESTVDCNHSSKASFLISNFNYALGHNSLVFLKNSCFGVIDIS